MANDRNDWLLSLILDRVRNSKASDSSTSVDKIAQEIVSTVVPRCAELIVKNVKSNLEEILDKRRSYERQFEERLLERWKKPIDLLEILVEICLEAGAELNNECRSTAARSNDYVFTVLTALHARACQTSHEILALLRSGLADGAHARWRTLHEIAVIAAFIKNQGQETAKRYLDYGIIESYKEIREYQEHCSRLGYEPLAEKELEAIRQRFEETLRAYGKSFQQEYGWVPENILIQRNFAAIEEHVKLGHLRPYYRMACHNVHSGPKGIEVRLGLLRGGSEKTLLLAGPSNYGLADPGQGAAISLNQITTCLLSIRPTIERLSTMKAIEELVTEINPAFVEVQMQIEKEEKLREDHPKQNAKKE